MTQKFIANNFMGLDGEVVIELFDGHQVVVLAGKNGAGKSSFRLAIQSIFKFDSKLIPDPIREGQTESSAEFIDTDLDVRLVRTWKLQADATIKSTLAAYALDGAKYEKPADFVARLIGAELIDPSQFVNYDEKKQREVLLKKVTLPFDPDERAAKRKSYFDGRTDKTRKVKELTNQLAGYAPADPSLPAEPITSADLIAEHAEANAHNAGVDALTRELESAQSKRESAEANARRLASELDAARTAVTESRAAEVARLADLRAVERKDVAGIAERLTSIEETNTKIRKQAERAAVEAELSDRTAEESALTANIAAIDKQVADGLAAADFPFDGMSVTDDGVTVNGRSFASLNEAEQQYVAFEIATSGDPKLKLLFLKNGNSLDDSTLARIAARCEEREWTILAERGRDNSSEIGFLFDEGVLAVTA